MQAAVSHTINDFVIHRLKPKPKTCIVIVMCGGVQSPLQFQEDVFVVRACCCHVMSLARRNQRNGTTDRQIHGRKFGRYM